LNSRVSDTVASIERPAGCGSENGNRLKADTLSIPRLPVRQSWQCRQDTKIRIGRLDGVEFVIGQPDV